MSKDIDRDDEKEIIVALPSFDMTKKPCFLVEQESQTPQCRGKNWAVARQQLDRKLAADLERLIRSMRLTVPAAAVANGDPGDAAQTEVAVQDETIAMESQSDAIARIQEARQKMRIGLYGICEGCGTNIPVERLEAIPETTFCIRCAQEQEDRQGALEEER